MYRIVPTKQFEKSLQKIRRSGFLTPSVRESFEEAVTKLMHDERLPTSYRDHQLTGELSAYRECHLKGDLLLLYQKLDGALILVLIDIGSHAQLFG